MMEYTDDHGNLVKIEFTTDGGVFRFGVALTAIATYSITVASERKVVSLKLCCDYRRGDDCFTFHEEYFIHASADGSEAAPYALESVVTCIGEANSALKKLKSPVLRARLERSVRKELKKINIENPTYFQEVKMKELALDALASAIDSD